MNWDDLTAKAKAHWPLALLATLTVHLGYLLIVHVTNGAAAFFAEDLGLLASIAVAPVRSMGPAATYVLIGATMSLCVLSLMGREIDNVPRRAIGLPLLLLGLSGILASTSEGRTASGLLGDALEWGFASFAGSGAATVICVAIFLYGLLLSRDWFFFDHIRTWIGESRPAFANDSGLAPMNEGSRPVTPRADVDHRVADGPSASTESRSIAMVDLSDFDEGDILPVSSTDEADAPDIATATSTPSTTLDSPEDDLFLARLSEELDAIEAEPDEDVITAEVPIVTIENTPDESDDSDIALEGEREELEFIDELPDDTGEFEALVHDTPLDFSSLADLEDDQTSPSWAADELSVEAAPTVEEGGVLEMADPASVLEAEGGVEASESNVVDRIDADEIDSLEVAVVEVQADEVAPVSTIEGDATEGEDEFDQDLVTRYASIEASDDDVTQRVQVPTQQFLFGEGIEVVEDEELEAVDNEEEDVEYEDVAVLEDEEDDGVALETAEDDDEDVDDEGFELIEFDGDEEAEDDDDDDDDMEYELVEVDEEEELEDDDVEYEFVEESDDADTDLEGEGVDAEVEEEGVEYELIEDGEEDADTENDLIEEDETLEFELIDEDEDDEVTATVQEDVLEEEDPVEVTIEDDESVEDDVAEDAATSLIDYAERASEIDSKPQPAPVGDDWAAWDDGGAAPAAPAAAGAPTPGPDTASTIPHEIYEAAVALCVEQSRCSVSILQRGLGLTFPLASECIERMESEGLVGPYRGSGYREILRSPEDAAAEEA